MSDIASQATPKNCLRDRIMNPSIAKSEPSWAARHIAELEDLLFWQEQCRLREAALKVAEERIKRAQYECDITANDYASDSMPFEVADVVGRIDAALEDKP